MKQKIINYWKILFLISLITISANNVYSLGIAPSKKIIDYDTSEHVISARIINNEERNVKIMLSAEGILSKYVTIDNNILNIRSYELEKEFTYRLQLPVGMDIGPQTINIVASEISADSNENSVSGLMTITHQLQINIPYATKQLDGYASVSTTNINDSVITRLILKNSGSEDVTSITGTIMIMDRNNKIVYSKEIEKQEGIKVKSELNIDNRIKLEKVGEYLLEYEIFYDEKKLLIKKDFSLGEYNIAVIDTKVNNFRLGTIAKFNIKLLNEWNSPIDNVYTELIIKEENGTVIGQTNTAKSIMSPGNNNLELYWDTVNITKGRYLLDIKIFSDDKIITHEYITLIDENKIEINPTGNIKETSKITLNARTIVVIILTTMLIILILVAIKMHNSRGNNKIYK
ncbi:MAG: hypothetical protein ACP5N1_07350 [Candidatus Woesearchaeota archaeon]